MAGYRGSVVVSFGILLSSICAGQNVSLSLGSGSAQPGGSTTLSLGVNATGGVQPATLQWVLSYTPSAVSGITVLPGATATTAGKSVVCAAGVNSAVCLVYSLSNTAVPNGEVAKVVVQVSPTTTATATSFLLSSVTAADGNGSAIATTSSTGALTIQQSGVPSALSCAPASITATGTATCTLALTAAAGRSGLTVSLASSLAGLKVPSSLTIAAGQTSGSFVATAANVTSDQSANVTATGGGVSKSATIALLASPAISALSCSPSSVNAGARATCTMTLARAATGLMTVAVSSNSTAVTVPATVSVNAGATSAAFSAVAASVSADATATLTATSGAISKTTTLAIVAPVRMSSLTCDPTTVAGGSMARCVVRLTKPAGSGGASILLSNNNGILSLPLAIGLPAGGSDAAFGATAAMVTSAQSTTVSASYGGATSTATLNITVGPKLTALTCASATVLRGSSLNCTVMLSMPSPAAGTLVALQSGNAAIAVPGSVMVAPGATSATFSAAASAGTQDQAVTLTAVYGDTSRTASVTARAPLSISGFSCAPATVTSGGTTGCTVTLNRAPDTGATAAVTLTSSNATLMGSGSVTLSGGQRSGVAVLTAGPASSLQSVTIRAALNNSSVSVVLGVQPKLNSRASAACPLEGCALQLSAPRLVTGLPGDRIEVPVSVVRASRWPVVVRPAGVLDGAAFDAESGMYSWTAHQKGAYRMAFIGTDAGGATASVEVEIRVGSTRAAVVDIVNPAGGQASGCSPGAFAEMVGAGLTTRAETAVTDPLPTELAGVRVLGNGQALPMRAASEARVQFRCPDLGTGTAVELSVLAEDGTLIRAFQGEMAESTPGIYLVGPSRQGVVTIAGSGVLAVPEATDDPGRPARRGEVLTIRANGLGAIGAVDYDGRRWTAGRVVAVVGAEEVEVTPMYSGLAMDGSGNFEVEIQLPARIESGPAVPLYLKMEERGGRESRSNVVTFAVEREEPGAGERPARE